MYGGGGGLKFWVGGFGGRSRDGGENLAMKLRA